MSRRITLPSYQFWGRPLSRLVCAKLPRTMSSGLVDWALPQLSRLLPLDHDSLKQVIAYTASLSKNDAAEHLKNLLGDTPQAFEFIASFNTRSSPAQTVQAPRPVQSSPRHDRVPVPQKGPKPKKPKQNIHALPPRQIQGQGDTIGAYRRDDSTLQTSSSKRSTLASKPLASNLALRDMPDAVKKPTTTINPTHHINPAIANSPQHASPAVNSTNAKTKVSITGGTAMHGASTVLDDLDSAIRSLEVQTNPTLSSSTSPEAQAARKCNCMATRHPLLTIAPNCLQCGKVICIKEGLGPCTFCSAPLLSATEISNVLRVLKDERGKEKQATNNAPHKRAEIATKPRAFTGRDFISATSSTSSSFLSEQQQQQKQRQEGDEGLATAKSHRDKLLAFQAQNAKRTRIHDEAADYDVPAAGTNMWASPTERARQLKQQQKMMRDLEAANRPEWERKRQVMSIDVVGNKVVKRMVDAPVITTPAHDDGVDDDDADVHEEQGGRRDANRDGGAFSRNPLLGALIRPVMPGMTPQNGAVDRTKRAQTWRRVQDDSNDNEEVILDGGAYGGRGQDAKLGDEERAAAVGG